MPWGAMRGWKGPREPTGELLEGWKSGPTGEQLEGWKGGYRVAIGGIEGELQGSHKRDEEGLQGSE